MTVHGISPWFSVLGILEWHLTKGVIMSYNIGDTVEYKSIYGENVFGKITGVSSDMDSYEYMEFHDGVPYYASKKKTAAENKRRKKNGEGPLEKPVYVPVKPKNMDTVYLSVENKRGKADFIYMEDIENVITA